MRRPNLPTVTEDTIKEVSAEATADIDKFYRDIAILNPFLYRFVMNVYKLPDTNKETMLGMFVMTIHALDRQIEKGKKKRLRHNNDDNTAAGSHSWNHPGR